MVLADGESNQDGGAPTHAYLLLFLTSVSIVTNGSSKRTPFSRYVGRNVPTSSLLYPKVIWVKSLDLKE